MERCRGSGQGSENLGMRGCLCGHAGALAREFGALMKLLEMLQEAFQRGGAPVLPSFRSYGGDGAPTQGTGREAEGQRVRGTTWPWMT